MDLRNRVLMQIVPVIGTASEVTVSLSNGKSELTVCHTARYDLGQRIAAVFIIEGKAIVLIDRALPCFLAGIEVYDVFMILFKDIFLSVVLKSFCFFKCLL